MPVEDFRNRFVESLREVGELLEEHDYEINAYGACVDNAHYIGKIHISNYEDTPEEALDKTINELGEGNYAMEFTDEELLDVINSELDASRVIYRRLFGSIDVDEPYVNLSKDSVQERVDVDESTDPIADDNICRAFGITIRHRPEFPDNYWQVGTAQTQWPYTQSEAEEQVHQIIDILNQNGHEAEEIWIM